MTRALCLLGLHRWRQSRVQNYRYGSIVTDRCRRRRCAAERERAVV